MLFDFQKIIWQAGFMASSELIKYIESAREKKASDEKIKSALISAGWGENEIAEALKPKSDSLELPPPPVPHFNMWVSFQYVLLFISLYISATSFGTILHYAVNQYIPDKLDELNYSYSYGLTDWMLSSGIAGIIVTFPIFAVLFILLKRQTLERPAVKNIKLRKILIYLTLIGTFLVMIGHLIYTIYSFLEGSTTTRSGAHLLINLIIAGSIFGYLLGEVREDRKL